MSSDAQLPHRVQATVLSQTFWVDPAYSITKGLGQGAYGCVASAVHRASGESIAIKRISNVFTKRILTKRALREIKLLRHFRGHKNITCLYDLDITNPQSFNEVYLYEELMEADLHAIIRSGQPLSDAHFQSFIYQTLCGLKYIHSANVLHRDLKPGNLLVNADCELKICDFGLSRGFDADGQAVMPGAQAFMTEYVATRWYRAPEIMLSHQNYTTAIDLWSVGCILAELLGGKPLFKGRDYVDQLNQILYYLGTPPDDMLARIASPRAQQYIKSLPFKPRVPFEQLFPDANPLALDLLRRLLAFDPAERITCDEALRHPYLAVWHDPADEPVCSSKFDFSFEQVDDIESMKKLILNEVISFRREVRLQAQARQQMLRESQAPESSQYAQTAAGDARLTPRRQDSLPVPSREEIERTTPEHAQFPQFGHDAHAGGFTSNRVIGDGSTMEDPNESLERQLSHYHVQK
ncbi:mitogen-activated protein kinase [Malassezia brasiliensis]|uniref:Mitogen-activated protein kinase n=1 Tax=Malassezia brasiliensis TaxID=1821822 RepID=A0AAF0INK1_9BASI|nr:mitogen-activated protein kinase [Malassezia brasiliensis]